MSSNIKSIFFAGALCLVCSLLLTTASTGLQTFQQRNMLIDKQKNILKSVGLIQPEQKYSAQTIQNLFEERIESLWVKDDGNIVSAKEHGSGDLPIYLQKENNEIAAYIVPIDSRGLWGRIHGYLAIEKDGSTIAGFTVFKHQETPGLGGEIEKRWFQKNFEGKKIVNQNGEFVSIAIAKGAVKNTVPEDRQMNYVDGISGATLTGKYLTSGFKEILGRYENVLINFRHTKAGIQS
jgi:Na+-transporting NADH:ubiquinone oxidoreductase subunit C